MRMPTPGAGSGSESQGFTTWIANGGGGSSSSTSPLVYLGQTAFSNIYTSAPGRFDPRDSETATGFTPQTSNQDLVQAWLRTQFASQSSDWVRIYKKMSKIAGKPLDPGQVFAAWDEAVANAALAYNGGHGAKITPEGYLDLWAKQAAKGQPIRPTHERTTETQFTSPASAAGDFQAQAQRDLGRRATSAETAAAYSKIHSAESASPATRVSNRTTDAFGNSTTTATTTGGLDQAATNDVLHQQAMQSHDYGSYQAATTLFNALLQILGAANNAGA